MAKERKLVVPVVVMNSCGAGVMSCNCTLYHEEKVLLSSAVEK